MPANQNLGCNPTNVPTAAQEVAGVTANNACGSGTMTATSADTTNGCLISRVYTISAVDGLREHGDGFGDQRLDGQPHGVDVDERAGEPEPGMQSGQCADGGDSESQISANNGCGAADGEGDERGHDQRLRDHAGLHDSRDRRVRERGERSVTNTWTGTTRR